MSCCTCYAKSCSPKPPKSKCPTGNCLHLPHLLLGSGDSVGPCNETAFVPFEGTGIDTTLCGLATPVFTILSSSDVFKDVSITSSGITFTSVNDISNSNFGMIEYAVTCGKYSSMATLTVVFKNLCASVICGPTKECDKCTGNCVDKKGDLGTNGNVGNSLGGLTVI